MKIIKVQEDTDGKGSMIYRPSEPFPSDTIYTTLVDKEYVCYQPGDTLPEEANLNIFRIT